METDVWLGVPLSVVQAFIAAVVTISVALITHINARLAVTRKLVEDVKATVEDVYTQGNSHMGLALESSAVALRQVADMMEVLPTATPERKILAIERAERAEKLLAKHNEQQAVVDAGLKMTRVSDE